MTEDGKFEVGDLVRCIEAPPKDAYQLKVGTTFKVTKVNYSSGIYSTLRRIDDNFGECFRVSLFELVQPFGTHKLLKRRDTHAGQKDL